MTNLLVAGGASAAAKTKQRLEGGPRLPTPVGPENELIKVDLKLPAADTVVSTHKPVLEVADHLGGPEPRRERRLRVVENCPGRHRDLVTARGALPSTAASHGVGRLVTAPGTGEALWPATRRQVVRARFLGGELLLKLPEALRERWPGHLPTLPIAVC